MRLSILLIVIVLLGSCKKSDQVRQLQLEIGALKQNHNMKIEIATKNKVTVKAFFRALEEENVDALVDLFANEGKHINPYDSGLFPKGANGQEEIRAYWTPVFPNFDGMSFPIEEIYAMEDPRMVFVKYTGNIKLKNSESVYSNNYYSTFKFNDHGKITEYVEIFNPIVAAKGFGLIDQIQ
ncbi:nuclear transport factor 2 family protein [Aquimarina sp. D1M17]|uniref:nuclear transport factor 2 family protein n=1 Tax=Aquimarina acroporae TaxID=2937283 RepID=UPI0020BDE2DC|nr:nuclear transport factor 2 family protein [Aquimarina acroporae]MCK8520129.1 nuclear transport factor 2 family protein [Aquimarina acroporae]